VAFICVAMIGLAGYLKYELDHAESVLAAPESIPASATVSDQEGFDKLRRALGYSGFIGVAQNFATVHDAALLPDMKAQLKDAEDILARLPPQTSAGTRRDLRAILDTFNATEARAEKAATDPATPFTLTDLTPVYAALPVLDARVAAAWDVRRATAQGQAQFWSMLLTLTSWCSLIIAAALTAGIYLTLRDRNSAPLRALAQSVKNMARGDMRTSIWGMERRDSVGELARAVDLARFQFSQMPDMALLSDQGPIRLRFEGNTRSMFEAMMRVISRDSEQVHEQSTRLNDSIGKQQETLNLLIGRVEAVLQNVENRAVAGDQQVRQSLQTMLTSAEGLKRAQEHAADQLNRVIPFMQERAQGLSEITQITGKQVAHVLQSLIVTERSLKQNAVHGDEAIKKLSSTADNLGERLFGAVNLLQASGRVLAETTEKTQSRLDEAIESLKVPGMPETMFARDGSTAMPDDVMPQIENIVEALDNARARLETLLSEQAEATKAHVDLLATQSSGLLTQTTTAAQTLSSSADKLRDEQARLDEAIGKLASRMQDVGDRLETKIDTKIKAITAPPPAPDTQTETAAIQNALGALTKQVSWIMDKVTVLAEQGNQPEVAEPPFVDSILHDIKNGFDVLGSSLEQTRQQMAALVKEESTRPPEQSEQMRDQWHQMAAQIEATRANLALVIEQEVSKIEIRLAGLNGSTDAGIEPDTLRNAQHQMEQQTNILSELVATLGVLDAHMQEIRSEVAHVREAS
jgi:HAMP domain-containing protein